MRISIFRRPGGQCSTIFQVFLSSRPIVRDANAPLTFYIIQDEALQTYAGRRDLSNPFGFQIRPACSERQVAKRSLTTKLSNHGQKGSVQEVCRERESMKFRWRS